MRKSALFSVLLLCCLVSAQVFAGGAQSPAAGGDSAGKNIVIQFWNSFTGSDGDILRKIVDNYNKTNKDGITIEMDIIPGATLSQKFATAFATKTAPAMAHIGNSDLIRQVQYLSPLDDFFEKTGANKSDFEPASLEALQHKGSQYVIPFQWFSTFLYWNKDLFRAAGLDPEKPPKTWDEIAEYAAKLTNPAKKIYGYGIPIKGAPNVFVSQFLSNGGEIYDLSALKSKLDSSVNLETLKWMQNIANRGYTPKGLTGADIDNLLFAGQVAMYINGPWLVTGLRENKVDFGVAGMPKGKVKAVGVAEVGGWAIPKDTPADQKAAAYTAIAFLCANPSSAKEYCVGAAFPPYLKSVANDPQIQSDPLIKIFAGMGSFGIPFGSGLKTVSQINGDVLFPMIENIIAGADCQAELSAASRKIDALLATE
jgi:multiple sugar transport system substrate-binding protein